MKRKKMNQFLYLAIILGLHLSAGTAYRTYYVEDRCRSHNHFQKIEYNISSQGPDSVGELRTSRFGTYSREGRSCEIFINPPKGHGVVVSVTKVDFRNSRRCRDYIKIYSQGAGDGEILCDYEERGLDRKSYFANGKMKIFYHTEDSVWGFNDGFKLIFTIAKTEDAVEKSPSCSSPQQFRCLNQRCIWIGVTCDGHDNCGDASDEKIGGNMHCPAVSPVVIATIVLMITVFAAVFIAMLICCLKYQQTPVSKVTVLVKPHSRTYGYVPIPGCSKYGSFENTNGHHIVKFPTAPPLQSASTPNFMFSPELKTDLRIIPLK